MPRDHSEIPNESYWHWFRRWLRYPLACKLGLHTARKEMIPHGFADWRCPRCGCIGV